MGGGRSRLVLASQPCGNVHGGGKRGDHSWPMVGLFHRGGAHGPGFERFWGLCGSGVLSCGGGGGGTGQLTGWANSIKAMDGGRKEGMKEGWKE